MRLLTEWTHAQQLREVGCKFSSMLQKHEQHGQLCALLAREHQPLDRALVPALGLAAPAVPSAAATQLLEAVSQLESTAQVSDHIAVSMPMLDAHSKYNAVALHVDCIRCWDN